MNKKNTFYINNGGSSDFVLLSLVQLLCFIQLLRFIQFHAIIVFIGYFINFSTIGIDVSCIQCIINGGVNGSVNGSVDGGVYVWTINWKLIETKFKILQKLLCWLAFFSFSNCRIHRIQLEMCLLHSLQLRFGWWLVKNLASSYCRWWRISPLTAYRMIGLCFGYWRFKNNRNTNRIRLNNLTPSGNWVKISIG